MTPPQGVKQESWPDRARQAALLFLFAFVLLIPKMLSLRHSQQAWNAVRVFVALVGAALVVVPLGWTSSWIVAVVGLVIFLLALLSPSPRPEKSAQAWIDRQARELGALIVVNGGRFHQPEGEGVPAQLFVAPERVLAFGPHQQPLVEIPFGAVSSIRAAKANGGWRLQILWSQNAAEFFYSGFFAEHLARVAENTLRSQLHRELHVLN